jgi:RNA polymerase sigma-70 factor (ECF subfamily)
MIRDAGRRGSGGLLGRGMSVLAVVPRRDREALLVTSMPEQTGEDDELSRRSAAGDGASWQALVGRSHDRLRRVVAFRLDPRLRGRVDPSDVLQDAYIEAWRDLGSYLDRPEIPFFLWLRGIAGNNLRELNRHHLGAQKRDPRREVSIQGGATSETTTTALAAQLLGDLMRASEEAVRRELKLRLHEAIDAMEPLDREVLALRYFEQLSPAETAWVLGIKERAAGVRYLRAVRRLKEILQSLGGDWLEP